MKVSVHNKLETQKQEKRKEGSKKEREGKKEPETYPLAESVKALP